MMLEFKNVIPAEKRIDNYAQMLFAEEAPGILRKAVDGAMAHLAELDDGGNFKETDNRKPASITCSPRAKACDTSSPNASERVLGGSWTLH